MEAIAIFAGLAIAVNKTVSVIKALLGKPRDLNLVLTQIVVWGVGTGAIFLAGAASLTSGSTFPGTEVALVDLDAASKVLLGWICGATGSFLWDFRKAVDNTDTANEGSRLIS